MYTIGKVASLAGISADTLRYYEKEQLIIPAQKSAAGYRLYEEDALRRLRFIKQAQECGFTLAQIRELLTLKSSKDACCQDVLKLAVEKKLQLEAKIKSLQSMSAALSHLITICSNDTRPLDDCPILAALDNTAQPQTEPGDDKS